jgi:MFS family permease
LNEQFGWRMTFVLMGLPGLLLALLARFTLREPRTDGGVRRLEAVEGEEVDLKRVFFILWRNVSFRHLLFAYSAASFFGAGIGQWTAAFFIRSFGLGSGELGTWLALANGASGFLGIYLGGTLASRFAAGNERLQLRSMAAGFIAFGGVSCTMFLMHDAYVALALLGIGLLGSAIAIGPLFAMIQSLVPGHMRAMAIAIVFLCANLVGMGLGPLLTGAISDALQPWAGSESLRWALLALSPGYCWCAWHFLRASRTVQRDLEQVSAWGSC